MALILLQIRGILYNYGWVDEEKLPYARIHNRIIFTGYLFYKNMKKM